MIVAGLTGSIGMGKTTTANLFREEGIPVFDADATVHTLYEGETAKLVEAEFPGVVVDGSVDRKKLAALVVDDPDAMKRLEAIVHPLVRQEEEKFIEEARRSGEALVILDHPLLFEMNREATVDIVIVVSTDAQEQRRRVLARDGMTEEKFRAILDRQLPDREKRKRADHVIETGSGIEDARLQVKSILEAIAEDNPVN